MKTTNQQKTELSLSSDQLMKARDWIAELTIAEEAATWTDAQVQSHIARFYDQGLEGFIFDSAAF